MTGCRVILVLICFFNPAWSQSVKFEENLSWEQLKSKAKAENKLIFLDVMATWCAPCKAMESVVYASPEIGKLFNKHFLSVKVQTDKTESDSEFVKSWYEDSKRIAQTYSITGLPGLIFLSPEGELALKATGYKDAEALMTLARKAMDPANQYYVLLQRYILGKCDTTIVNQLASMAEEMGRTVFAAKLKGKDFLSRYGAVKPVEITTDLSGTWTINYPKCEFGDQPIRAAAKILTVKRDQNAISISRHAVDDKGEDYIASEVLPFNGRQKDIANANTTRLKKALLLDVTGNDLTEFTEVTYPDSKYEIEYTVRENWKLSEDGKQLTVERVLQLNTGSVSLKLVYDKK